MFWAKLCKSNWNCAWNLAFPVFISPIVWNMCENLHYESVYFKELHNDQECYWPTIYRAGVVVVSTITTVISANIIASHAGVFRGARFSHLPREEWITCLPKNTCVGCYQYHFSNFIWYCERGSLQKHPFLLALRRWGRFVPGLPPSFLATSSLSPHACSWCTMPCASSSGLATLKEKQKYSQHQLLH